MVKVCIFACKRGIILKSLHRLKLDKVIWSLNNWGLVYSQLMEVYSFTRHCAWLTFRQIRMRSPSSNVVLPFTGCHNVSRLLISIYAILYFVFTVCLPGWISSRGYCYLSFSLQRVSWDDANINCLSNNSRLASIQSDAENVLVKSLVNSSSSCSWIGLRFYEDKARWSGGSPVQFSLWQNIITPPVREEGQCGAIYRSSRFWVKKSCSSTCYFICKRKGESLK